MEKSKKPPEKLAQVWINNGQHAADLVRECDPTGDIVEHRVRKSAYVHERLHSSKKLADEQYDAAEQFRKDFERAQLSGNYAASICTRPVLVGVRCPTGWLWPRPA